ncbi:hypothetical protein [Bacillus sp. PS06]|uniref:hypothetical protein n=1 Tax=Bacillus sp. PS06 TaxID=2764176 RepID=UPI0017826A6A|nr:hypothetical protein [Bacillus sp. PS06]MBD8069047.1 hypothetical protein [Bacillus sp. PS06]
MEVFHIRKIMFVIAGYLIFAIFAFIFMDVVLDPDSPSRVSRAKTAEVTSTQIPTNEPTIKDVGPVTAKGGIGDYMDKVKEQGEEEGYVYKQAQLETPTLRVSCGRYEGVCSDATIYFNEGVSSAKEAFFLLEDHLPSDITVRADYSKKNGSVYVYDLTSELLGEKLEPYYKQEGVRELGHFHVSFRINSDDEVFAAVVKIGEEVVHND